MTRPGTRTAARPNAAVRLLHRPVFRRVLTAVCVILVGIGAGTSWYHVSVQPGAALVKMSFESGPGVWPAPDFEETARLVAHPERVSIPTPNAPDAALELYVPHEVADTEGELPVILWIHGGGFISSSTATVEDYAVMLAASGYVVASLDYSLAPGEQYPVPVLQAVAALDYLVENGAAYGLDATRIFLGGDSAGAQIASQLGAVATNPELAAQVGATPVLDPENVRGILLFCGLYDMRTVAETGFPALRTFLWAYTGHRDWTRAPDIEQLSTTLTATADYPATFLTVGDADPFAPQSEQLAGVLRDLGVPVRTLFWDDVGPGLGHEYQFDFRLPQAEVAWQETVEFLAERSAD